MNDVINPFQITHPTAIQTSLLASALFSKFDPSGRWIAAGKQNGSVVIWDLDTKAPVRVLDGHVRGVTSVDWSRYGRYVLTSSKDWNVIVWDLAERLAGSSTRGGGAGGGGGGLQRMKTVRFDSSVMSASFHPRNSKIILVLLSTGELFITDLRREYRGRVELCDTLFQRELREREREREKLEEGEEGEGGGGGGGRQTPSSVPPPTSTSREAKRSPITVARFDISGRYVFAGTANGMLLVFNTRTKAMVGRHRVAGAGTMKSLDFTRNGRRLVTNSSDRTLRQFTIPNYQQTSSSSHTNNNTNSSSNSTPMLATATTAPNVNEQELEPTHRFNDPINKTAWHVMAYSPDGEWLAGGGSFV
ncbi:hypothetical protein D9756_000928 [Leucocoprinus leucothites]|uniref:WD40 repeat-like protein n=1 Tax=Leucocoprinus leucothites TaxID=201217 RepID=A0A8H5LP32_9AGAR|nr:hypothetical protein D9756_000928 [Leucoagaricus leucothites]